MDLGSTCAGGPELSISVGHCDVPSFLFYYYVYLR